VRGFEDDFAEMMVETGLPRMMARVLACLAISDSGVLTAAELVQRLKVSPASISHAVGYLEGLEDVPLVPPVSDRLLLLAGAVVRGSDGDRARRGRLRGLGGRGEQAGRSCHNGGRYIRGENSPDFGHG
jgi:hypothetical protein